MKPAFKDSPEFTDVGVSFVVLKVGAESPDIVYPRAMFCRLNVPNKPPPPLPPRHHPSMNLPCKQNVIDSLDTISSSVTGLHDYYSV